MSRRLRGLDVRETIGALVFIALFAGWAVLMVVLGVTEPYAWIVGPVIMAMLWAFDDGWQEGLAAVLMYTSPITVIGVWAFLSPLAGVGVAAGLIFICAVLIAD